VTDRLPEPTDAAESLSALLLTYLDFYRGRVVAKVMGLSGTDRRSSRLASGWTPLELLHHLRHVERRWMEWGFVDAALPEPWADHRGDRWFVPDDLPDAHVIEALRAQGRRTREITELVGPGARGVASGRWRGAEPATVERVLLHLMQEYARHLGHLDVVVEIATGAAGE
jgi:hypothetical protein